MSQDQMRASIPTFKEDIYAIGALMVRIFCGINPVAIQLQDNKNIKNNLTFFTDHPPLIDLIIDCVNKNPKQRPNIDYIINFFIEYKTTLSGCVIKPNFISEYKESSSEELDTIISKSILTLQSDNRQSGNNEHDSLKKVSSTDSDNQNARQNISLGLDYGMAGLMIVLANAHKVGYHIDQELYSKNLMLLLNQIKKR